MIWISLLAYSLIGAFLAGFLDSDEDVFVLWVAPVAVVLMLVGVAFEVGFWLREKMKGR